MDATAASNSGAETIEITGENGFLFDERLGEAVRKHKCLYDKNEPGYKDLETTVMNAWNDVARETNLANGETAKRLFCNLKKRFLKKRLAFRKANGIGRSKEQLQRAKDAVDSYSFLTWLTPHIRLRETKNNIARRQFAESFEDDDVYLSEPGDINIDDAYFDHCKEEPEGESRIGSDDPPCDRPTFTIYAPMERQAPYTSQHPIYSIKKRNSPVKGHTQISGHPPATAHGPVTGHTPITGHALMGGHIQMPGYSSHATTVNSQVNNGKDKWLKKDPEEKPDLYKSTLEHRHDNDCDLFGQLVSAELKTLDMRTKTILKHKIQTLIFEAKIAQLPANVTSRAPQQENAERPSHSPLQQRSWDEERYSGNSHAPGNETNSSSPSQHGYKIIAL